ncbi:MAG: hypothetical protein K9G64_04800 [Bacteroidia bacterium]|nr:hypothetical protein [Bacteroidia bacterium]
MKSFIFKILLFTVPFLLMLVFYIALDPFKVVKKYDNFFDTNANGRVALNKDFISTTNFDNQYKNEKYNSFIFGNSRSIFYQVSDWKKFIDSNSQCYHFDASGECIYAIHKKVKYIDSKGLKIKNVILVLDYTTLIQYKPKSGHLFVIPPQLVNNRNILTFHFEALKAFLSPKFLLAYIDYKISGKVKPYMTADYLIEDSPIWYESKTNEIRFSTFEKMIAAGTFYTADKKKIFSERDKNLNLYPISISKSQKFMLKEIYDIFKKHGTNYKIIINPLYNQTKFNEQDLIFLKEIFGKEKVFDFSGINKITNDFNNYYETEHYRPTVALEIMKEIYKDSKK